MKNSSKRTIAKNAVCLIVVCLVTCSILVYLKPFTITVYRTVPPDGFVLVPMSQVMRGEPVILEQDDKRIIRSIWIQGLLQPPSKLDYNITAKNLESIDFGPGTYIRKLLGDKKNGYFVESGAFDGETGSNTLYLERHLNFTGLLVEADPDNFAKLKMKNRKAWISNICLAAAKPYPHMVAFHQSKGEGHIENTIASPVVQPAKNGSISFRPKLRATPKHSELVMIRDSITKWQKGDLTGIFNTMHGLKKPNLTTIQCLPLFSLLSALNVTTVDYWSLDVEGSEYKVLTTFPFDKVFVKILSVEYWHTREGKQAILELMAEKGYRLVAEISGQKYPMSKDLILVHKKVRVKNVRP